MLKSFIRLTNLFYFQNKIGTNQQTVKRFLYNTFSKVSTYPNIYNNCVIINKSCARNKSKISKKQSLSETSSDSDENDNNSDQEFSDKISKIIIINLSSARIDAVIRTALGVARNRIETLFYESKIKVNGEMLTKKSIPIKIGDEIDIIKSTDLKNPNFINVSRIEILSIKSNEESLAIKIRRWKSLSIEA